MAPGIGAAIGDFQGMGAALPARICKWWSVGILQLVSRTVVASARQTASCDRWRWVASSDAPSAWRVPGDRTPLPSGPRSIGTPGGRQAEYERVRIDVITERSSRPPSGSRVTPVYQDRSYRGSRRTSFYGLQAALSVADIITGEPSGLEPRHLRLIAGSVDEIPGRSTVPQAQLNRQPDVSRGSAWDSRIKRRLICQLDWNYREINWRHLALICRREIS